MGKTILLVDDDEDIMSAMRIMLENEGYAVKTAETKSEIENALSKEHPDIILLDILLSGEDGGEIARSLKTSAKTRSIPIILLSAHPKGEQIAKESLADDFLAKPFDIDVLLDKVKKFL